jgi:phosphoribosylformylglycinamidine synthase
MSLAEALTNMVFSKVDGFDSISFSATWQWPCGQPGEMVRFYDATDGAIDMVIDDEIGLNIPVGKDSTSMTAKTTKDGKPHAVKAPGTVQMVAFAPCPDITKFVTPDIKRPGESRLALIGIRRAHMVFGALSTNYGVVGVKTIIMFCRMLCRIGRTGGRI